MEGVHGDNDAAAACDESCAGHFPKAPARTRSLNGIDGHKCGPAPVGAKDGMRGVPERDTARPKTTKKSLKTGTGNVSIVKKMLCNSTQQLPTD